MTVRIQLRRDTAANWASANPTPADGEACFERDTGVLKIANGTTAYNLLPGIVAGVGAAADVSIEDLGDYFSGTNVETVTQELAETIQTIFNTDPVFDPQAYPSVITVVQYMTVAVSSVAVNGWYYPGNTTALSVLTNRVGPVEWHGTAAQKPADGTAANEFRIGDKFIKRPDLETL